MTRAGAALRVHAARDSVQPLVDDADLVEHRAQLLLLRRVRRRLVELARENRERRQRRVELVRRAGRERAELDDLLIAQRVLAHGGELAIALAHEPRHAADEQDDQHGGDHEVHPHAGEVQIELAAEAGVHGRQRHAAPPQQRVAGAAHRNREPGVARRQRRRRERDRHEVQRDERIRRAAREIQDGREDDDVDGEVQAPLRRLARRAARARARSSARSTARARRWRARARAAATGRRARDTRARRRRPASRSRSCAARTAAAAHRSVRRCRRTRTSKGSARARAYLRTAASGHAAAGRPATIGRRPRRNLVPRIDATVRVEAVAGRMVRWRRVSSMAIAVAAALPFAGRADDAAGSAGQEPSRELGTVTVIGRRPSSLPTQIPTTIEGISGEDIRVRINATDAEDALKYFPSLLVRKRYIGDYDHAVLATRASGTGNSARSLVYVDGILISNLLGNGASFTPRWGLVTPEEIERVDVLYGPFSAAYPGNSVGAVVDYVTRMPDELEMNARVSSFSEDFHVYRSRGYVRGPASERVGRQPPRPLVLVAELQSARQRRAPRQLCEQAREQRRARHGRHGRHGRARRAESARSGLADLGLDDGDAHDPGSREAQGRLRDLAAPALELHARLRGTTTRSARRRATCAMRPATRSTRARSTSTAAATR